MSAMPPVRVLVADDHPMFREGLVATLDDLDEVVVVGQAGTGEEAVALAAAVQPDVVLMDLHMPGIGGIAATEQLIASRPEVVVLVLTMVEDADAIVRVMRAGARGYLLKEATPAEIMRSLAAVADGQAVFGGQVADRVLAALAEAALPRGGLAGLTEREAAVLDLLARGLTNAAIAERLFVTPKTVRNYVSALFTKLGVHDRASAVARARDAGYGGGGPGLTDR